MKTEQTVFRNVGPIIPAYTTYEDGTDRVFRNVGPIIPAYTTYEDGTDRAFRNVGTKFSAGESPKVKDTTFTIRRKFEIKKCLFLLRTTQLYTLYIWFLFNITTCFG